MKIKVILKQDVRKLWSKWDIVEVAPAYAQNVLIKQWLAQIATPAIIKEIKQKQQKKLQDQEKKQQKIDQITNKLKQEWLTIKKAMAPSWKLYEKVDAKTIQKEILNKYWIKIDLNSIKTDKIDKIWDYHFKLFNHKINLKIID